MTTKIWIGLYLAPAYGEWVEVDSGTDPDELHARAQAIVARFNAECPEDGPAEEYAVFDHEGFVVDPGETADFGQVVALAELSERVGDRADAFEGWMDHRGRDYALFENGRLRDVDDILADFEESHVASVDEFRDFVQEQYGELLDQLGVPAEVQMYIDWDAVARDWEIDTYYVTRKGGRDHVFWRS